MQPPAMFAVSPVVPGVKLPWNSANEDTSSSQSSQTPSTPTSAEHPPTASCFQPINAAPPSSSPTANSAPLQPIPHQFPPPPPAQTFAPSAPPLPPPDPLLNNGQVSGHPNAGSELVPPPPLNPYVPTSNTSQVLSSPGQLVSGSGLVPPPQPSVPYIPTSNTFEVSGSPGQAPPGFDLVPPPPPPPNPYAPISNTSQVPGLPGQQTPSSDLAPPPPPNPLLNNSQIPGQPSSSSELVPPPPLNPYFPAPNASQVLSSPGQIAPGSELGSPTNPLPNNSQVPGQPALGSGLVPPPPLPPNPYVPVSNASQVPGLGPETPTTGTQFAPPPPPFVPVANNSQFPSTEMSAMGNAFAPPPPPPIATQPLHHPTSLAMQPAAMAPMEAGYSPKIEGMRSFMDVRTKTGWNDPDMNIISKAAAKASKSTTPVVESIDKTVATAAIKTLEQLSSQCNNVAPFSTKKRLEDVDKKLSVLKSQFEADNLSTTFLNSIVQVSGAIDRKDLNGAMMAYNSMAKVCALGEVGQFMLPFKLLLHTAQQLQVFASPQETNGADSTSSNNLAQ